MYTSCEWLPAEQHLTSSFQRYSLSFHTTLHEKRWICQNVRMWDLLYTYTGHIFQRFVLTDQSCVKGTIPREGGYIYFLEESFEKSPFCHKSPQLLNFILLGQVILIWFTLYPVIWDSTSYTCLIVTSLPSHGCPHLAPHLQLIIFINLCTYTHLISGWFLTRLCRVFCLAFPRLFCLFSDLDLFAFLSDC